MFTALEVRPVIEMKDSAESFSNIRDYLEALRNAGASGHSFKVFHSIYATDEEGLHHAIGDFDTEEGARLTCIGLGLPWSIMGRNVAVTRFTGEEMDSAMAVWEAMIDAYQNHAFAKRHDEWVKALSAAWERVGTAEMRSLAGSLGVQINALWGDPEEALETWGDASPFDWGFVPFAIAFVDWETGSFPTDAKARMLAAWDKETPFDTTEV